MYQKSGTWTFDERICEVQLKIFGSECNLDCYMCMHDNSTTRQNVADKGVWNDRILVSKMKVEKITLTGL